MRDKTRSPFKKVGRSFILVALVVIAFVSYRAYARWDLQRQSVKLLTELPSATARRADMRSTLLAGGTTESAVKRTVECELERIEMRSENRVYSGTGASTILTVIADGTNVKKGDVLCTLDSSEYEEFVRLQEIKNERAKADLLQAKINLETSQMALHEFERGLMAQTIQYQDGVIALRQTDVMRANDRLLWSGKMLEKGYVSVDQVSTARQTLRQADLEMLRAKWEKRLFIEFGAPRQIKILTAAIESARAVLINETRKFERFEERLAYYRKMVELCTIRAPQDGMVIYANERGKQIRIEPGLGVRQHQDLFHLPDIAKMEIKTYLHESISTRVTPGMRVRTRIPALHNRELEGYISKIDPLPFMPDWLTENKFFVATVKLDSVPRTIRPDMTAEVEIALLSHENAITVPTEAIAYEKGQAYCYVMRPDGLEKREVSVGLSDRELMEVSAGLDEGEEVLVEPKQAENLSALVYESLPSDRADSKRLARLEDSETVVTQPATPAVDETAATAKPAIVGTSEPAGL